MLIKYKFVSWDADDKGDEYITNDYVINLYKEGRANDTTCCYLLDQAHIKRMGYIYDFRDILKKFVYKTNYGIYEGYAPNKTLLRKNVHTKCHYVIELKED